MLWGAKGAEQAVGCSEAAQAQAGCVLRQGDAKDKLLAYVEKNPLDMLVIGRSLGNRLKMVRRTPSPAF